MADFSVEDLVKVCQDVQGTFRSDGVTLLVSLDLVVRQGLEARTAI